MDREKVLKKIFPQSVLGLVSVVLAILVFVFYIVFFLIVFRGERGGDHFFSNLALAIPIILLALSGISAFIVGMISIFKNKDRSVFVILATLWGFFVLYFFAAEIFFPH